VTAQKDAPNAPYACYACLMAVTWSSGGEKQGGAAGATRGSCA